MSILKVLKQPRLHPRLEGNVPILRRVKVETCATAYRLCPSTERDYSQAPAHFRVQLQPDPTPIQANFAAKPAGFCCTSKPNRLRFPMKVSSYFNENRFVFQ